LPPPRPDAARLSAQRAGGLCGPRASARRRPPAYFRTSRTSDLVRYPRVSSSTASASLPSRSGWGSTLSTRCAFSSRNSDSLSLSQPGSGPHGPPPPSEPHLSPHLFTALASSLLSSSRASSASLRGRARNAASAPPPRASGASAGRPRPSAGRPRGT